MNNSLIAQQISLDMDDEIDLKPVLAKHESDLTAIVEAIEALESSKHWKVLQERIFQPALESLLRRLRNEKNPTEIYRLQGRIEEAEKWQLQKLLQVSKMDLQNIRKKLDV